MRMSPGPDMRRLLAVAAMLLATAAHADTTEQDLAKYRRLRQRLVTDFASVGPERGQSQPCPERNDKAGTMKWADSTIALGFYLGVLATELHLLSHPETFPGADGGNSTQIEKTREELYHALLAMERLDRDADAAFPPPCTTTPSLNGFFIRDDVPADLVSKFPGITTVMSDYIDPVLTNKEESQDQVYHVQHGLALAVKLVPPSVTVKGRALRAWAALQAQRIAQHFAKGDWIIRNPACGDRAVNRGANAAGYSYGEALAIGYVTAGALKPIPDDAFLKTLWDTLRDPANPIYVKADNLHMALAIMAVGDGFGADTAEVMAKLSTLEDWPLYPLLHRVLQGEGAAGFCKTAAAVNQRARLMLDELPADGEPACPTGAGPAPHGFTSHNRFIRGKSHAYVGAPNCSGLRYHGLDYLLLHNLYAIATPATWKGDPAAVPKCVTPDAGVPAADATSPRVEGAAPPPGDPACACTVGAAASGGTSPMALLLGILALLLLRRARRPSAACRRARR